MSEEENDNGYERRKRDQDHDMIVEIHGMVKAMNVDFKSHEDRDLKDFNEVHRRINGLSNRVYIGIGVFILANVILIPILLNYFKG